MADPDDSAHARRTSEDERRPLLPHSHQEAPAQTLRPRRLNKSATIAIILLIVAALIIAILGFILPKMAQRYIEETLQVGVSDVKVLRVTDTGAEAQADLSLYLDASKSTAGGFERRLADKLVEMAGTIRLSDTVVQGFLVHEGEHRVLFATPDGFSMKLGGGTYTKTTIKSHFDLLHLESLSGLAEAILDHDVSQVSGRAHVTTTVHKVFAMRKSVDKKLSYKLPSSLDEGLPKYNISQLAVKDDEAKGLSGSALLKVFLQSPFDITVPSVSVDVLIDGCNNQKILLATGHNAPLDLDSHAKTIQLKALGSVGHLPKQATEPCPNHQPSPLDRLMQLYLAGNDTRVYVRGSSPTQGDASWLQQVLSRITIPVDLPGSQSDQLARDIELADVKFNVGGFFRQEKPKISGNVNAVIDVPAGIHVKVDVKGVKILADLIYKGKKFATFESPDWAPASSSFIKPTALKVQAQLRDAPVTITDNDVFTSVVSALIGGNALLDVSGVADVRVSTGLGNLEPHGLPLVAKDIEIGGLGGGLPSDLESVIHSLGVVGTTPDSLDLAANVGIQNPTPYGGYVHAINVLMVYNGSVIGSLTGRNITLQPGGNVSVDALLMYDPTLYGHAAENCAAFSQMLSLYLSELPVNLTLRAHAESVPGMPNLSNALAHLPLEFSMPIPQLHFPDDSGDDNDDGAGSSGSRFLISAKFHVFSSTAQFTLRNPLNESVTITELDAQARYHEDEVGIIQYTYPITLDGDAPTTETSRLPVSWSLPPSDILRKAIRGTLRVNATAQCRVSIGVLTPLPLTLEVREVGAGVGI
ncbi:hypothetical protein BCR37DRAFT_392454 [Protomyces lactucae-debilis]|uniref:Pre-rRNA processing protein n=1 Tax=Protomyces lactucae-debilis TaxID=2754530 RepID=A0A1Y2FJX6_PROLT|nr:uncharacterized protein BCR37DRAFT_392454 [Protomyces lactucae-debilis]ORY83095.1 hypothetical protein BCR37DRAFT_392454 [Protomyces lactucae-debilis]